MRRGQLWPPLIYNYPRSGQSHFSSPLWVTHDSMTNSDLSSD